jgi:hypothetical protein
MNFGPLPSPALSIRFAFDSQARPSMQSNQVPLVVLAAALSASAMESEVLNSERIERRFGNYGIEVVSTRPGLRRSNLFSTEDGIRVCRTYAVVLFADQNTGEISKAHEKILAGGSIGAVFRENGWEIFKETIYVDEITIDDQSNDVARLMSLTEPQDLATHIYRLRLRKADLIVDYATIIETHHPDYLTKTDLDRLYGTDEITLVKDDTVSELISLVLRPEQD